MGAYNQQLIRITNFSILLFIVLSIGPEMEKQNPFEDDLSISIKPRDYKCPCGKTYLSYAALFTHIKQKHEGKAPGKISKPPSQYEKRGRPPIKSKQDKKDPEDNLSPSEPPNPEPVFPPETEEQRIKRQRNAERVVAQITQFLLEMPMEDLNKAHLNEIQVFSEMNVYLNTRTGPAIYSEGNICVADGFFEFARAVCSQISWKTFEPFYLLFMLFLQFIIDSLSNKKLLTESSMDIFCEYINDFIENHLKDMAEYYQLQNLWIIRKQNSIRIFFNFFHWCMHKRYVSYRINMAQQETIKSEFKDHSNIKVQ